MKGKSEGEAMPSAGPVPDGYRNCGRGRGDGGQDGGDVYDNKSIGLCLLDRGTALPPH